MERYSGPIEQMIREWFGASKRGPRKHLPKWTLKRLATSVGRLRRYRPRRKGYSMHLLRKLARKFLAETVNSETAQQRVFRLVDSKDLQDTWRRRIIELSDGKSISEITEILYREELKMGAWVVDIGLWKHLFDQGVITTLVELAQSGYVCLKPAEDKQPRGRPTPDTNRAPSLMR